MSEIYYSKAVNEALDEELARDPNVIMIGEDIGCYGGAGTDATYHRETVFAKLARFFRTLLDMLRNAFAGKK